MVARRSDALAEAEATKWKMVFCGQEECWRTERIAAIEPRMYMASRVIATWTALSEHISLSCCSSGFVSCSLLRLVSTMMEGQSGEL